jgi:mono/diheme cytochrome c family protein
VTVAVQALLRRSSLVAVVPCVAALAGAALDGGAPADPRAAEGQRLYGIYCVACHGEKAHGDGPTAAVLRTRPADLTRLTRKNKGAFPGESVRAAIDGRGVEHGTRNMPLWGVAFQDAGSDLDQEDDVRVRIDALVSWIEAIQR